MTVTITPKQAPVSKRTNVCSIASSLLQTLWGNIQYLSTTQGVALSCSVWARLLLIKGNKWLPAAFGTQPLVSPHSKYK